MDPNTLGDLLERFRQAEELSQRDLAEKSDLPAPSISYYENNRRIPPLKTLARLLDSLDARLVIEQDDECWQVEPDTSGDKPTGVEKVEGMVSLLKGLDPKEREDILEFLRLRRRHSGG